MRTPLALTICLILLALAAPAAGATTYTVETTSDGAGNPADCTVEAGTCSLRSAILASVAGDTIVLPPGTYDNTGNDFTIGIGDEATIVGAGARSTTVREVSGGDGRVFLVEMNADLRLTGVTVAGSRDNAGLLMFGGGNTFTGTRVAFRGNTGGTEGGGIDGSGGGSVTLIDSLVAGNTATTAGGGIFLDGATAAVSLTNTTVTGNAAPSGSGIAAVAGTVTLARTTLAGNTGSADLDVAASAAVGVAGSILGGCSGTAPASSGFNVSASCALGGEGDRAGDPLLGALADNGGETDTLLPAAGSPAIDAGGSCPATDQRGVARPQGSACDAGAVEVAAAPLPPLLGKVTALRVKRISRRAFRVRYRLSHDARVRFRVERCTRVRGGKCRNWKRVRAFTKRGDEGRNAFRMRARGLRLGRHRIVARPLDGTAVRRPFRVRPFRP